MVVLHPRLLKFLILHLNRFSSIPICSIETHSIAIFLNTSFSLSSSSPCFSHLGFSHSTDEEGGRRRGEVRFSPVQFHSIDCISCLKSLLPFSYFLSLSLSTLLLLLFYLICFVFLFLENVEMIPCLLQQNRVDAFLPNTNPIDDG